MNALLWLCKIIERQLNLPSGRVMLWNNRTELPKDQDLFVLVRVLSSKVFGNSRRNVPTSGGLEERISVNVNDTISIDIMSRGTDARDRRFEVLMAFNSSYASQVMAAQSFYIAKVSSGFADLSNQDGSSIPYRFNISVNLQYSERNQNSVDYYDSFEDVEIKTDL